MTEYRILIVEDNVPINRLFCKNLNANGFSCEGVFRIDAAIQALKSESFDAIILDFELPDGYGIQVLDYLHHNRIAIPTVVVSASTRVLELRHYHQQYLVKDILVKPVSPRHLNTVVHEMLSHQQDVATNQ